jgi:AcrR family transcriptional regulator
MVQARAEATRRRIVDAAVTLFSEHGYGDTGLADVMQRAEISKGAFYYHFESKEALASAIIDEGISRLLDTFRDVTAAPAPALENTVRATFRLAHMTQNDDLARIANQLRQALSQVSGAGAKTYVYATQGFLDQVEKAVAEGDVRADIAPGDVAETICAGVLGCHLLSDAMGDDPFARLARTWRVLLRSIVSDDALPYFHDFLSRTLAQYSQPTNTLAARELTVAGNGAPSIPV